MGTQYSELQRRVFIGFPRTDGEAILAIKQAINDAVQAIAGLSEASSLLKVDVTNAKTAVSTKSYNRVTDWLLTRPKDIYSIRLIDAGNSRKLTYTPQSDIDLIIPYPEQNSTGIPKWYTPFGDNTELLPIPDAIYNLTVRYSQWPAPLISETDESPYGAEWDSAIVFISKDIANAYLNGEYVSASQKASEFIQLNKKAANNNPDQRLIAKPFNPSENHLGSENYWENPFRRSMD